MKTLPARTSLSQVCEISDPVVVLVPPPTVERENSFGPPPYVDATETSFALDAVVSRIVTPVTALALVLSTFATRAMIVPSPLRVW